MLSGCKPKLTEEQLNIVFTKVKIATRAFVAQSIQLKLFKHDLLPVIASYTEVLACEYWIMKIFL